MSYLTPHSENDPTPPAEGQLTLLAHGIGVEVPHLVIALATLAAGIATLLAF